MMKEIPVRNFICYFMGGKNDTGIFFLPIIVFPYILHVPMAQS